MKTIKTILADLFDLHKDRAPLEEIKERIYSGGTLKGTNMCILILAIFIASIGLNMNSTAVAHFTPNGGYYVHWLWYGYL